MILFSLNVSRDRRSHFLELISLLLIPASLWAQTRAADNAPLNVLTQAVQVLSLTPDQAERRYPVQLRGVVTCFDQRAELFFVQDASAGIYVYRTNAALQYKPGELVELTGTTGSGLFSPIVLLGIINVLGTGSLPVPKTVSIEQLASGKEDSQWVQVEGIVHRAAEDWGHLLLEVVAGTSRLKVRVLKPPPAGEAQLTDAKIRVQGVVGTAYNNRRQVTGFLLWVPGLEQIHVVNRAEADPFIGPVRPSRSLLAYSRQADAEHRVRLRGVVTLYWPGQALFIRDESGGIQVQTEQRAALEVGDVIEAVGFPALGGYTPVLKDAVLRRVDKATAPRPTQITAAKASSGDHDNELVQIEAGLVAVDEAQSGRKTFILQEGKTVFQGSLQQPGGETKTPVLQIGSRLMVTGICSVGLDQNGKPNGFSIRLRSPQDIAVLQRPAWWKRRQVVWAGAGLGLALALGLAWIASLKSGVRQQTEAVRRRETVLEGRYHDLFENANDILFTLDFAGKLTSLNKAGEQLLGYPREEALQMNLADIVVPEQREWARHRLDPKATDESRTTFEMEAIARNGYRLFLEVGSRPNYQEGRRIGIQGVARDITARKHAEAALRQSEQQLRNSLEERERLGRDLHDGLIQSIYAVGLNLEDCKRLLSQNPAETERRLGNMLSDLNAVISDVRNFILGLESTALRGQEFKTALKSLILTLGETHSLRFSLQIDSAAAESLNSKQATELLHIAREAMSNSVRHANAKRTVLSLQAHERGVRFEVQDDGSGFNPDAVSKKGYGLTNMAARADKLGARIAISSQIGQGTRIVLDMPAENHPKSS